MPNKWIKIHWQRVPRMSTTMPISELNNRKEAVLQVYHN